MEGMEKQGFSEAAAETEESLNEVPELLYSEDKKPGKNGIRPAEGGEMILGGGSAAVSLTDRDRMTLSRIRDLAAETPEVIEALMKADDTPAMVKVRIVDMIWDRTFGKPEATVNFNQAGRSMEASEIMAEAERLRCLPCYCEANGDKGFLVNELRKHDFYAKGYTESQNKFIKITTYLRKYWGKVVFLEGTDPEYVRQILDYTEQAEHDDAADSAACVCRLQSKWDW